MMKYALMKVYELGATCFAAKAFLAFLFFLRYNNANIVPHVAMTIYTHH